MKMFSLYTNIFEFPGLFNSRISLTQRLVSKPVPPPKKYTPIDSTGPLLDQRSIFENGKLLSFVDLLKSFKERLTAIYPGTLWCGDGNQARSEHEVGLFSNTDACCRMHDKCPKSIPSGQGHKGLRNNGLFTRSHCECDLAFYKCLKKANSIVSNKIG